MFEVLAQAIDEVDIPADCDAVTEAIQLRDRLDARITMAVAHFDRARLWDLDGDTSMTAWLGRRTGMTSRDASATVRTGRRLRHAPVTAAGWLGGCLSGGQVAAVCANVNDRTAAMWGAHEAAVVPTLVPLPVGDVAAAMRVWAARAEAVLDEPDQAEPERSLHLSKVLDGCAVLTGSFDPEAADLIGAALRVGQTDDPDGGPARTPARRRADALMDVCRFFLDNQSTATGGRHRPHVNLIIDLDRRAAGDPAAAHTADGIPLRRDTISRYLCDCGLHRVVTSGASTILDYGRRTQTIPPPCSTHWSSVTGTVAGRVVTGHRRGARATTSGTGRRAAPPGPTTSSCSAPATTTGPTNPGGT